MRTTHSRHSEEYRDYMASAAWTARKKLWDAMATPRQRRCQARSWRCKGPKHHHHRRYWRYGESILWGKERHRDIVSLCERHHDALHAYGRRHHMSTRRASRHYLWAARARRYLLPPAVAIALVLAAVLLLG